jgi:type I restriction enzyme S subunit
MSVPQQTPLEGHIIQVSERKGDVAAEILSVTSASGLVRSLDTFDKQVFSQDTSAYKLVRADDLAYNPSRIDVGSIALCELPAGGAVSPMYVVVRCKPTLDPRYLLYFLRSEVGRQHVRHRLTGGVRSQLRFADLEQISLRLPPRADQERLVGLFDELEGIGEVRADADAKLAVLRDQVFLRLFGDPLANDKGWPMTTVGDRVTLLEYGPRFPNALYSEAGVRIVRITDLERSGDLNFATMPRLEVDSATLTGHGLAAGDIIFARSGATVGKVAVIPPDAPPCIAGAYFVRLRFPDEFEPEYILGLFRSAPIQRLIARQAQQAAQPNFSGPLIRALPLPVPDPVTQCEFVRLGEALSELRDMQGASRAATERASSAFAFEVFAGQR